MLEEAGLETWAVDILGWGFSDLGLFYLLVCVWVFWPISKLAFTWALDILGISFLGLKLCCCCVFTLF